MARLAKNFPLIALLCGLSLAADCTHAGSCSEARDETSLVQVKQMVTHGSERAQPAEAGDKKADEDMEAQTEDQIPLIVGGRFVGPAVAASAGAELGADAAASAAGNAMVAERAAAQRSVLGALAAEAAAETRPMHPELWRTPVTNMRAVADATPAGIDLGAVQDSFGVNSAKTRDAIVAHAQGELNFANKVKSERQAIQMGTMRALQADKMATAGTIAQDRRAVAEAAVDRMATVADSVKRVNQAKELAIAHGIKQKQAQYGALLGRTIGAREGAEVARLADMMQKRRWMKQKAAMVYGREKLARMRGRQFKKVAADRAIKLEAAGLRMEAERTRRISKAMQEKSAAETSLWEDDIEGPEGTKNKLVQHAADRIVDKYKRITHNKNQAIGDLSIGADGLAVADEFSPDEQELAMDGGWDSVIP